MLRDVTTRVLRALLAVWFVLSVGEPSVVRICPMHASAAAELADAGLGGMAHHSAGHHAHHDASGHSHSSREHQHHCTCIDCCVASSPSALAARGVELETLRIVAVVAPLPSSNGFAALAEPAHLLPPSTGPPRV